MARNSGAVGSALECRSSGGPGDGRTARELCLSKLRWLPRCALAARRSVCTPRPKPATRHTTVATRFAFNLRTKPLGMRSVLRAAVSCCWQWFCMRRRAPAFGCGLSGSWRKLARISVCSLGRQTLERVLLSCSSGAAHNWSPAVNRQPVSAGKDS